MARKGNLKKNLIGVESSRYLCKVRLKSANVNAFVNIALLDSYGAVCMNLRDSVRSTFFIIEFSFDAINFYVYLIANSVVMTDSVGIFT